MSIIVVATDGDTDQIYSRQKGYRDFQTSPSLFSSFLGSNLSVHLAYLFYIYDDE